MPALRDRLKPLIPQIVDRELTNRAVAAALGVSEFHVSRVLKQMGVKRNPPPTRESRRALIEARQDLIRTAADDLTLSVDQAAKQAFCSTRSIHRYRAHK